MQIRRFDTATEAGLYAATIVEQVMLNRRRPVLGLATGASMLPVYDSLIGFHREGLDFASAVSINLDEYVGLPRECEQSLHAYMDRHLMRYVNVSKNNMYIPNGDAKDLDSECARYDEVLRANPRDVQLLGIGVNGHIAFNEPDDSLSTRTHVVSLANETITSNSRFFDDASRVPRRGITMGLQSIMQSKKIVLLAFGQEKSHAVRLALSGKVTTDIPASMLQLHPDATVVLDANSAELLSSRQ
ncbi:glucosamine-6-phosphate deaminase [Alicyclobacillus sp. SO9]|uniref:glucosamine-6-phosphate deaminase n=1 Tax=Alicyclobacillus sp. SO9 TaxID=2665646 RepID=UPI0018E86DE8|nr:glucosamine-6-phosphate deaminase [Alicyclobacillus sp. SO9]QQE80250.1 glucosamine-6-phosphate deaminase [Alicyclobacillus sp. SO9]